VAVELERELVEIGLKVFVADAMMNAVQPRLQVREDQMDDRHKLLRHLWVTALGNRMVVVAVLAQPAIAAPIIGDDQRAGSDDTLDEAPQRSGASVGSNCQADPTSIATVPSVVLGSARLPVVHLDSGSHQRFMMDTSTFAARPSAQVSVRMCLLRPFTFLPAS